MLFTIARQSDYTRPRRANVRAETTSRNPNTRLDAIPEGLPAPPPIAAATVPHSNITVKITIHPNIVLSLLMAFRKFRGQFPLSGYCKSILHSLSLCGDWPQGRIHRTNQQHDNLTSSSLAHLSVRGRSS